MFVILRLHMQFHIPIFIQDVDFNYTQEIFAFRNVWLDISKSKKWRFCSQQ